MRIGTSNADTNPVKAASIAGMTLDSDQDATDADAFENDGLQFTNTYKGIGGTIFCQGANCRVEVVADDTGARKFVGSWYFTPGSTTQWYLKNADGTAYEDETLYARFGHWLTTATDGDDDVIMLTVNRYADTPAADGTLALGADEVLGATATYSGPAAGMSVHKTFDDDNKQTGIYSSAFTADVELTATFGDAPTVSGTVDNFEGTATDSDWSVELLSVTLGTAAAAGTTTASGQDGEWSAQAYGAADARPTGVFGGFNAHFSDGHAAGAYATRKD